MNNKVLITVYVPMLESSYDIFIPISKKLYSAVELMSKVIYSLSEGAFTLTEKRKLINKVSGQDYNLNLVVRETDIRNGTKLILL